MSDKMSKDRVHFTIRDRHLEKESIRLCIQETLGIHPNQLPKDGNHYRSPYTDLHVICRPSQFARFVILRHVKYGEPNNMACLDMKLVLPPEPTAKVVDVSQNMNKSGGAP